MTKKSRVVVITGGGSGMGKAMAERFAQNDDQVYIVGRRAEALNSVAKASDNIHALQGDVTKPADVEKITKQVIKGGKGVDVLINCAGGSGHIDPELGLDDALDIWRAMIDTNLTSAFLMIQAFRPHITRPGGRIINVSSSAAFAGSSRPGGVAYASAKAGLHGLMRTLVKEFAPEGVTINTIAPGATENTDFFGDKIPEDRRASMLASIPLNRLGQPEEIAAAAFYLASDEAGFITGEVLNVNGGAQFGR